MSALSTPTLPTDRLGHGWTVGGTVLMGGAVTMAAWWMSASGLAELAAVVTAPHIARAIGDAAVARRDAEDGEADSEETDTDAESEENGAETEDEDR